MIDSCQLSALQLEAVTYACQQHETFLADGRRAGFLIGNKHVLDCSAARQRQALRLRKNLDDTDSITEETRLGLIG